MITRRGLMVAGACLSAAAASYELRPRRHVSLLGSAKLADIVPIRFGDWIGSDVSDLVAPATDGSLTAKLYGETVERVYQHQGTGLGIMMLLAHGESQSNELQLHRPEICYPAFGFHIAQNRATRVTLAPGVEVPTRSLVCDANQRRENVLYWARLGEFLPETGNQQRIDRLRTAFKGEIADGLLARFSVLHSDPDVSFGLINGFVPALMRATQAQARPALIGTALAKAMSASSV